MTRFVQVEFTWPTCLASLSENFFFGAWHPTGPLKVNLGPTPEGVQPRVAEGGQWILVSNTPNDVAGNQALVHGDNELGSALAFRGYVLEPPLHSYSDSSALFSYWLNEAASEHNGVFSAAVISNHGRCLKLTVDALGMSPLYFRSVADIVLFATNPRFLATADDKPDLIAWRSLLEGGFVLGDRSLTEGVRRVPAGRTLVFERDGRTEHQWFDFASLPEGTKAVDDFAVQKAEDVFRGAMDKCLKLGNEGSFLPLSSGHDSRRILAGLLDKKANFDSATVRVFQKGYRDLDATYAAAMARDYGFPHRVIEGASPQEYVADDAQRRLLVDSETLMHSWVPRLMRELPPGYRLFWDGILGDILGNPGFRLPNLYQSPRKDIEIIAGVVFPGGFESILNKRPWPSTQDLREELTANLNAFPMHRNIAELAFMSLRQRRATAPWSHQMLPTGHIPVCPYVDLDYIRLLLEYDPAEKHKTVFQRACLERFWPALSTYPGNRDIPPDAKKGDIKRKHMTESMLLKTLFHEVSKSGGMALFQGYLSPKGKMRSRLSCLGLERRWHWALHPLLELVARHANRTPCWSVETAARVTEVS